MRRIFHREVPHFVGLSTILVLAFMIWAVIWLGDQQMNEDMQIREGNIGEILYDFLTSQIN
ncbi:MAG: hypothetical protein CR972_03860 [Candidatus Moraniibacteriota bacterium]|nr:MAG: hypothetical protein CR972_03860 [Candidatus Moranbacteria bacterium]